jgi:C-terminal processing protease CtpA/Prc
VAERAFRLLDRGAVARLVVDVRHNGGGDSRVDDPLIDGLRSRSSWRQRGRLYGLISGETFSSAMWTADDLRRLGAVLVGTPTGGKPNSYGNVSTFQLPNSLIQVGYSTRYYELVAGSDPPWVAPEIQVEPTVADLRAGRDPLLEATWR